jgi:hypothetical protein
MHRCIALKQLKGFEIAIHELNEQIFMKSPDYVEHNDLLLETSLPLPVLLHSWY